MITNDILPSILSAHTLCNVLTNGHVPVELGDYT